MELILNPGTLVLFNGDRLWHKVTPLGAPPEERVILTMEYLTDPTMTPINRITSNVKDAIAYFGVKQVFFGANAQPANENDQRVNANQDLIEAESVNDANEDDENSPHVLVFINPKSGGQRGREVLPELTRCLGADCVFGTDSEGGPVNVLRRHLHRNNLRVVAGGGDGTIRWVIQAMLEAGFDPLPPIAVLPLGTGNDLSRGYGWGRTLTTLPFPTLIRQWKKAERGDTLDIWDVELTPLDLASGEPIEERKTNQIMFNYWNIGFDAAAAIGFHSNRKEKPHLYVHRTVNKMWYVFYAASAFLKGLPALGAQCSLSIDGEEIQVPPSVRTLIVLNFTSYQAGLDIWGNAQQFQRPGVDDGIVEVVGLGGIVHEALVRLEISKGVRLGQGRLVEMKFNFPHALPTAVCRFRFRFHAFAVCCLLFAVCCLLISSLTVSLR